MNEQFNVLIRDGAQFQLLSVFTVFIHDGEKRQILFTLALEVNAEFYYIFVGFVYSARHRCKTTHKTFHPFSNKERET